MKTFVALAAALVISPFVASWAYYNYVAEGAAAPYARGNALPFNRYGWVGDYRHSRYLMVDDLLEGYDFRGWNRAEVEALLGESERTRNGFAFPAGEDYPGSERVPRRYALVFETDREGSVSRVTFRCDGEC